MVRQLILCFGFAIVVMTNIEGFSINARRTATGVAVQCLTDDQLAQAVTSLSLEYDAAQRAQRFLRQTSERSSACRQQVVAAVMTAMDKRDLDISRDQASANLWREGAVLLGELKATESLDLLLSHIKLTDGEWSNTMTHQPALAGIILIGPAAVAKLRNLLHNEDWQTRHDAVFCLANIGGLSARRAIEKAAPTESHPCVKRLMLVSIKTIDVKHGGLKQDRGEWGRAFMCTLFCFDCRMWDQARISHSRGSISCREPDFVFKKT